MDVKVGGLQPCTSLTYLYSTTGLQTKHWSMKE